MAKARLLEVAHAWGVYCAAADHLLDDARVDVAIPPSGSRKDFAFHGSDVPRSLRFLCEQGLTSLVTGHLMDALERSFRQRHAPHFWSVFSDFPSFKERAKPRELNDWIQSLLPAALAMVTSAKEAHEDCLSLVLKALEATGRSASSREIKPSQDAHLLSSYQTSVTALLLATLPKHFSELLKLYFLARLEEFSKFVRKQATDKEEDDPEELTGANDMETDTEETEINGDVQNKEMEDVHYSDHKARKKPAFEGVVEVAGEKWIAELGSVVKHLRQLGFATLCEKAYASAILTLLKTKIHALAEKRFEKPALPATWQWIEDVPMRFLYVMLGSSGLPSTFSPLSGVPSPLASCSVSEPSGTKERVVRWRLRLQFFGYEILGDLRIDELFDIIVDYPESLAAIEDLQQCLANTGKHPRLVETFRSALRQRLLTAGAATTDILTQYVATIKALRIMDPTGVVLEAVGEPIREYLRRRKDTIRCIVTMLTEDASTGTNLALGGTGESLLEELSKGISAVENADSDDDGDPAGDEAWLAAQRWEPDPSEADPSRTSKSRRSMDIIGMLVGIYGSKELFVNEYRIMLAEKLLNKSDYDTDREIRTLELLKLRFGETNMHSCEIMLKDLADSKRINSNIKVTAAKSEAPQIGDLSVENIDATIISALFWPPFQTETLTLPKAVDDMLNDYAQRYNGVKALRKLQWKKHLGTVKLELQFEDRSAQFVVSPMQASIIMHFEEHPRWSASDLAKALGICVNTLRRRIMLWINQGVLVETHEMAESFYSVVESIGLEHRGGAIVPQASCDAAVPLLDEEEGQSAVASMEDQWQQEMTVYESYVVGMLTNLESLPLDRIHNMLKMFVSEPPYDKTLQQLQAFLGRLVAEEKLELRDGVYRRKQ